MSFCCFVDYSDFDATPQIITFPSDDGGDLISEVDVSVAIQDDDINEALEQYFILTMDVMTATDQRSIDTQVRNSTLCSITDNDREFVKYLVLSAKLVYSLSSHKVGV